mmetsp:Transcript_12008/g.28094  ORF Transcript_12008/g.28094 Transcript_12008/m.28094 type:complete len:353 (+) Transcript_12008:3-1061(+)
MYDELWGRLIDGLEGWNALGQMPGRSWQADYAAAQRSRLLEALADYVSSVRSLRFLESVVKQVAQTGVECGICLQPLQSPRITTCAHIFCAPCILKTMATWAECPQCRTPLKGRNALCTLSGFRDEAENRDGMQTAAGVRDTAGLAAASSSSASAASQSAQGTPVESLATVTCSGEFGSKIQALVERLDVVRALGEKALVFAQWQDLIYKIHSALVQCGIPAAILAGGPFERASVLQQFESPELPVLLLSLEDSASGTNMAHANHVLLVHPMVAPSAEEQRAYEAQAIGRVKRWGQTRTVQVWRFVVEGTVEADLAAQHVAHPEVAQAVEDVRSTTTTDSSSHIGNSECSSE